MNSPLNLLKPQKSPYKLIRIGGNKDGAYLIPDDLKNIKACFSPGVSNRKDFEDTLAKKYKIKSYLCDFSSDLKNFKTSLLKNMQFFEKKWLDIDQGNDSITLEDWVYKYISNSNTDLILQMDIEGAEYRNILSCSETLLKRFRIIVIELHQLESIFSNKKDNQVVSLLKKLNQTHTCIHVHPNNCCGEIIDKETGMNIPRVIEVTYLRKDRFLKKSKLINSAIPNPKDISANLLTRRPLHLNKNWFAPQKREFKSKLKIFKDYLIWVTYGKLISIHEKFPVKNKVSKLFKQIKFLKRKNY
ncbi:FkbM family methyltransferase [uncultured Prochlorococcus sp.]|uniref:FkbM family methyltransferase n=1 Tax=uncultured Prochlorococcus sp. TaxID=159733 RepID=UPI00258536AB|nr:FkbM family methyltransferase [uncultured Prochlorococcus sp.]